MTLSSQEIARNLKIKTVSLWSRYECLAYLLLYAANADYILKEAEHTFINDKVGAQVYDKILLEFEADNDYQRIQKLLKSFEMLNYSEQDVEQLLNEIEALFLCDEEYCLLEQNVMILLKKIFSEPNHRSDR